MGMENKTGCGGLRKIRIICLFFCVTVLFLTGCGRNSSSGEKIWQGTLRRTGESLQIRDVRWTGFPEWADWHRIAASGCREITVSGTVKLPDTPDITFLCRLARMEECRYSVIFSGELHDVPLSVRGELDLRQELLSVDFQGRFAPAEYRLFRIQPQLLSGMADVRGSVLFSGGRDRVCNFPQFSILPVRGSMLQTGPFRFSCIRTDRREDFDGRVELEFRGASSRIGGMDLQFRKMSFSGKDTVFSAAVGPHAPWQNTVLLQGDGSFASDAAGSWKFAAELPEPGVCRCGKWICPLSSCHISGAGNGETGTWDWRGEGGPAAVQLDSGSGTGTGVSMTGHREFRMADSAITQEQRIFQCRRAELPFARGRMTIQDFRQEIRRTPDGLQDWRGQAGAIQWVHEKKTLQIVQPAWNLTLLFAGGVCVMPEAGRWSAASVNWQGGRAAAEGTALQGELLLREWEWQCTVLPQKSRFRIFGHTLSQSGGRFAFHGNRDLSGSLRLSGSGQGAEYGIPGTELRCGEWSAVVELLQYGASCGEVRLRSSSWTGPGGRIAEVQFRQEPSGSGMFVLKDADLVLGAWRFQRMFAEVPLGRSVEQHGVFSAVSLQGPGRAFSRISAELRPAADGLAVKGRAAADRTGGSVFFHGVFRALERSGVIEYSMPPATLRKEFPASALAPFAGDWLIAGKVGENGRIAWQNGKAVETRNFEFSGGARSPLALADGISGTVTVRDGVPAAARMIFGSFSTGRLDGSNGELAMREEHGKMTVSAMDFRAWGGRWKWRGARKFAVEKVQLHPLLAVPEWGRSVTGTFSGTVELAPDGRAESAVLAADGAGSLKLGGMEQFRYIPGIRPAADMLAFSAAAMRDFRYKTLRLRLLRRGKAHFLRVSAEGRPAAPLPFVYFGKSFRRALDGEPGFEDNVELSCWYRLEDGRSIRKGKK